jgi:phosphonate transport system ATP-binding protein
VSFDIKAGEMVALIGASGSGKSTLLRHVAGLALGGSGRVVAMGHEVQCDGQLARDIRRQRAQMGFVFQQFNLVGRSSLLTNILAGHLGRMPTWRALAHRWTEAEKNDAFAALHEVGLLPYAYQRASTLSGGQQQRAAIARTLVQQARLVLADEPIASLDPESCRKVMDLLAILNTERNITVVVSLHQVDIALRYFPRVIALKNGNLMYDGPSANVEQKLLDEVYKSDPDGMRVGQAAPRLVPLAVSAPGQSAVANATSSITKNLFTRSV